MVKNETALEMSQQVNMFRNNLHHNKNLRYKLFGVYSFWNNRLHGLMNILPHTLRKVIFKYLLGNYGTRSFIDYKHYINYPWKLFVGDNVEINRGFEVHCSYLDQAAKIIIDDFVIIGPNVHIYGSGQDPQNPQAGDVASSVRISRGAYIGADVTIRYGVTIGEGAIIGCGSNVTKSIPSNVVAHGNPAAVVG